MILLVIVAIVGAGLVTGVLFAFSNFVMSALARLSNENGMVAMQRVNEKIINPIFMLPFLGTPILCAIIGVRSAMNLDASGNLLLLIGAICYLIGPFGVTMICNVPLNNRLAEAESPDADEVWADYQIRWQRWNHVRTYIGVLSILLLATGLGRLDF
jgi:uncharacterized membrane protein